MEEYQRIYAVFKNDEVLHIDHTKGNCYKWIHTTFKDDLPRGLTVHQVKTIQTKDTQQKAKRSCTRLLRMERHNVTNERHSVQKCDTEYRVKK